MNKRIGVLGALGLLLGVPLSAEAARLSLAGRVELLTAAPVENARVTVVFHGHEVGIHEYTTRRRVRVHTDQTGNFAATVKVPEDRYIWTHAIVEIGETDTSKAMTTRAVCQIDENGGGQCDKDFKVSPLSEVGFDYAEAE